MKELKIKLQILKDVKNVIIKILIKNKRKITDEVIKYKQCDR